MSSSFSLNSDIVRIVSIGTLDLTFHLSITKSQSKQLNINLNELNETKDLSVLFDNNISNNDESIIDYITLSSNNFFNLSPTCVGSRLLYCLWQYSHSQLHIDPR